MSFESSGRTRKFQFGRQHLISLGLQFSHTKHHGEILTAQPSSKIRIEILYKKLRLSTNTLPGHAPTKRSEIFTQWHLLHFSFVCTVLYWFTLRLFHFMSLIANLYAILSVNKGSHSYYGAPVGLQESYNVLSNGVIVDTSVWLMRAVRIQGEHKKVAPATFVDISAIHEILYNCEAMKYTHCY